MSRFATIADTPAISQLLLAFAAEARVGFRDSTSADASRLARMLGYWIRDHYVRVAEQHGAVVGVLIAERGQDFWDPERTVLQERAWYVLPQYRNSKASARLWQTWQQDSDKYIENHNVNMVLMSTQGPTTHFDPGRRGWRLIEQTWIKE
jgi:hypothetical protein